MIERDYIMRMITMLVAMVGRILAFKNSRDFPQALLEIQTTGKALLGIDRKLVDQFSVPQLMQLFGSDLSVAVPKSYVLGVLLKEEAEVRELMHENARSVELYSKSLALFMETYLRSGEPVEPRHLAFADEVLEKLRGQTLPVDLLEGIFRYEEAMGRFARAEDALFAVLETTPAFVEEGILFYERLLKHSDDQLAEGNLPRAEVLEGMRELSTRRAGQ
jgi:hypothetical protein